MGCGWNPLCHVSNAASSAWDWLSGDGPASWVRGLLAIILIAAVVGVVVFLILTMPIWVQISMVVIAFAFVGIVIYEIVTRKKS